MFGSRDGQIIQRDVRESGTRHSTKPRSPRIRSLGTEQHRAQHRLCSAAADKKNAEPQAIPTTGDVRAALRNSGGELHYVPEQTDGALRPHGIRRKRAPESSTILPGRHNIPTVDDSSRRTQAIIQGSAEMDGRGSRKRKAPRKPAGKIQAHNSTRDHRRCQSEDSCQS